MMLLVIVLSLCAQVLLYILFRKQQYIRVMILLLFLVLHLYLLPWLFTDQMYASIETPRCGMGAIFIFFLFWIFGGSMTLLTHVCYWLYSRKSFMKKKNKLQEPV
jgi:hypothetical protein